MWLNLPIRIDLEWNVQIREHSKIQHNIESILWQGIFWCDCCAILLPKLMSLTGRSWASVVVSWFALVAPRCAQNVLNFPQSRRFQTSLFLHQSFRCFFPDWNYNNSSRSENERHLTKNYLFLQMKVMPGKLYNFNVSPLRFISVMSVFTFQLFVSICESGAGGEDWSQGPSFLAYSTPVGVAALTKEPGQTWNYAKPCWPPGSYVHRRVWGGGRWHKSVWVSPERLFQ